MKRTFSTLSALVVLAALAIVIAMSPKHSVRPVYAQSGCTLATLTGSYSFAYSALSAPVVPPSTTLGVYEPHAMVGVGAFDGAGNFSGTVVVQSKGGGNPALGTVFSGTYTIKSNCTGSMEVLISDPPVSTPAAIGTPVGASPSNNTVLLGLAVAGGGTEFFASPVGGDDVGIFDFKTQAAGNGS